MEAVFPPLPGHALMLRPRNLLSEWFLGHSFMAWLVVLGWVLLKSEFTIGVNAPTTKSGQETTKGVDKAWIGRLVVYKYVCKNPCSAGGPKLGEKGQAGCRMRLNWPTTLKREHWGISVQFSCSVVSNSLWSHESQHARPPCPSPTPGVHSDSCPLSRWCHPAISSSVVPFSSCPQSLPADHSLFQWVNSSHEVAKVLEFQLQHHSFQRTPRADLL